MVVVRTCLLALSLTLLPLLTGRAAAASAAGDEGPRWGVLLRGGFFGLPDVIADEIFAKHPSIDGNLGAVEIRYHGDGGPRGIASLGLGLDYGTAKANGDWQQNEGDEVTHSGGDIRMAAITLTGYWNILPSWFLHPYFGIGVGIAYVKVNYTDEEGPLAMDSWLPALHVPLGLALELGDHAQLAVEARFIDGISWNGAMQVRF